MVARTICQAIPPSSTAVINELDMVAQLVKDPAPLKLHQLGKIHPSGEITVTF